jgi:hypothetical protein
MKRILEISIGLLILFMAGAFVQGFSFISETIPQSEALQIAGGALIVLVLFLYIIILQAAGHTSDTQISYQESRNDSTS